MSREQKIPDASHPITVEPTGKHVRVLVGERVIGESDNALTLQEASYPPVLYVPVDDLDRSLLSTTVTSIPTRMASSAVNHVIPSGGAAEM